MRPGYQDWKLHHTFFDPNSVIENCIDIYPSFFIPPDDFLYLEFRLRNSGYRLVYQVLDDVVVVFVVSVGKRERSEVYNAAQKQLR
ncbi:type II toxin-antitoxin system RelE/ParE family toxin [Salinisphaera sp. G21_0]|nr:type II toxin-antitoxin system RelE/ParE family toxin [Salinisphaera sp. G21_0]MBO9483463.1 type II toxin-antitoxin system RelE/ParE family toxin [Salinisphaera sp. G21_0]